ncbi:MAG TPA: hypothetical protein PKC40_02345 [Saprospiraceae bacterium]|nr:hypothetical protein [Saprospiraceae bacterium]
MKKSYWIVLSVSLLAFGLFSAFSNQEMLPEEKEQYDRIETAVTAKLDELRAMKDKECMDRAMAIAVVRADSIMMAAKNVKPGKKPTTTKKGGTTPAKPEVSATTNPKSDKMQGKDNTQEKKDKIQGESQEQNTQKKKDKIRGGDGGGK